jgi:UDP-N-acetylglucosamine--N-acetylmuramyl-(pentapeptide) pyrophosphoryl-undecaprenol N-acetylglucosamine transferase
MDRGILPRAVDDLLWIGGAGGMEVDLVQQAGVPFREIPAAGLHGVGLRALPHNLGQIARGVGAAQQILHAYRPDVAFFTGGYVAGPVAIAASLPAAGFKRPRMAMYVPDIQPGQALKALALFVDRIAVTTPASRAYFRRDERVVVTGYPTRPDLQGWERRNARQTLGLTDELPVLFVWGGSKGSRSINRALLGGLPALLDRMQVVHITGTLDWPEVEKARSALQVPPERLERYHAYPYLHAEMGAALAAAALVIARAGASCLGEFPLFGLPAILVPYPYAWRYQMVNALYLQEHGAAVMVEDGQLAARLPSLVVELLGNSDRLEAMRKAMYAVAQPQAAESIASILVDLAQQGSRGAQ